MEKKRILLVDDKALLRDALIDYIGTEEYEIVEAATGEKAIDLFKNEKFDVVILDHNLPGMDGFKTLQLMKRLKPDVPIIGLTGELTVEVREKYLEYGAYDIHAKSAIYEKLVPTLKDALAGVKPPTPVKGKPDYVKIADELKEQGRWEESALYLKEAGMEQKLLGNKDKAKELFEEAIKRYLRAGRKTKALEVEKLMED
ncbi:MAG: hypothetical protein DRP88_06950 [Candidatus Neomarinimicrobiota bacterium]|nr:MAG: hypothetical protein DRP88_06950 [Candidatus Neomarinimicrobiota bacterium]